MDHQQDQSQPNDTAWRRKVGESPDVGPSPVFALLMMLASAIAGATMAAAELTNRPLDEKTKERIEKSAYDKVKRLMERAARDPEQRALLETMGGMLRGSMERRGRETD